MAMCALVCDTDKRFLGRVWCQSDWWRWSWRQTLPLSGSTVTVQSFNASSMLAPNAFVARTMRSDWLVQKGLDGVQSVIKPEELVLYLQVGHTVTVPVPGRLCILNCATGHHFFFSFTNQMPVQQDLMCFWGESAAYKTAYILRRSPSLPFSSLLSHSFALRHHLFATTARGFQFRCCFPQYAVRTCQCHHWFHGFAFFDDRAEQVRRCSFQCARDMLPGFGWLRELGRLVNRHRQPHWVRFVLPCVDCARFCLVRAMVL